MNAYDVIKRRRVTEKTRVLESLENAKSNPCLKRFEGSKVVFDVHPKANKCQIADAIMEIYPDAKVVKVNTITRGPKKRRVRGFSGETTGLKKAIVTFAPQKGIAK